MKKLALSMLACAFCLPAFATVASEPMHQNKIDKDPHPHLHKPRHHPHHPKQPVHRKHRHEHHPASTAK